MRVFGEVKDKSCNESGRNLRFVPSNFFSFRLIISVAGEFCVTLAAAFPERRGNLESRALARWVRMLSKRSRGRIPESRAKDARCIRTLTLILSLAGRGEDNAGWLFAALLWLCDSMWER